MRVIERRTTAWHRRGGRYALGAVVLMSLLAEPRTGSAMCGFRDLTLRPEHGPQPTNLIVYLEGYGVDLGTVRALSKRHPRLESSAHIIPLRVQQTYIGQQRLALAVLRPQEELRRNVTYLFAADGVSEEDLMSYGWSGQTAITFRADAPADNDPPVWISAPQVLTGTYRRFGCGPASFVPVAIEAKDAGPLFVKVELERAGKSRRVSYILPIIDGVVSIGHGMCSGAFDLAPGEKARAHLTLIDLAGNETPAPGGAVHIVGPGPKPIHDPSP